MTQASVSADIIHRIQSFRDKFGDAHLYFAYHAAFPIALTPDLLYCLWANFQQDIQGDNLNIPWIAVADLLLSPLCHEVGHELYEMELET
ncbi:MAG: formylglycine-generating enzyme family protein, partial [Moorea sp. SIO1F2]|nr:formylglycine-generating enzyme family protein [Moorena sp. SIO1F2]